MRWVREDMVGGVDGEGGKWFGGADAVRRSEGGRRVRNPKFHGGRRWSSIQLVTSAYMEVTWQSRRQMPKLAIFDRYH